MLIKPKISFVREKNFILNKVKKGKFSEKMPVRIIDRSSFGYYVIKLEANYKNKKVTLKSGEEYISDVLLLKKIRERAWNAIVKKNMNDAYIVGKKGKRKK